MSTQALIRAVVAESLQFDANAEAISALDRIIALGWATHGNALGAAMVHAHAQDPEALYRAVLLVARNLVKRYRLNRGAAEKIAVAAIFEYLHPACENCGGIGEIYSQGSAVAACPVCRGSKLKRYSDAERTRMCGLNAYPRKPYEHALGQARESFNRATAGAAKRLGG